MTCSTLSTSSTFAFNAQAKLQTRVADLLTKRQQSKAKPRLALSSDSTTGEEKRVYSSSAAQAEAVGISVLAEPGVTVSHEAEQINPRLAPGMAIPPAPRSINPHPAPC